MNKIIYSVVFAFLLSACTTTKVEQAQTETQMNSEIDRSVMPTPGPAPEINLKKPQSFTLDNGLKVMVVENHKLPRVSMNLSLDNPPVVEGDKAGVSALLSSMLGNGTSKISKDAYNEEIDFYGAYVGLSAGGASVSALSKYFPKVLSLAAQGALDPLLTKEEFESEKAKMLEGMRADAKNVASVASNVRGALAYGLQHPFGEFPTEETVENITFEDVKKFYKENFVPGDAYLVIVGDIKFEEAKKLATDNFANWKVAKVKRQNFTEPKNLQTAQIDFIDMPNAVQSEVATINVANIKMTSPDFYAAMMANQILGGGGEGRLFLNLREKHGWTYGSYSSLRPDKETNLFSTTASVRNAVTDSAVVEMINELQRIRTELVSDEELANAKAKYIGNYVMEVEKPETVARFALKKETQDLPDNFYENYIKNLNAVTPEEVRAAAQKYFGKDNARIVVVGKSEDVLPALKKLNMPINYYDRYAKPVEAPKEVKVSSDVTATGVVNNYLKTIGGAEKAKSIKSLVTTFEMTGAAPQPIQGQIKTMAPNKEVMTMNMNGMEVMKQVFDGKTLKVSGMMGSSEKSGDDVATQAAKKGIIEQAFYTADQLELKGMSQVNGQNAYKVEVTKGNDKITEYYDAESHLLVQSVVKQKTPQGDVAVTSVFKDYKAVNGVQMPHTIEQSVGPQNMVLKIKSYTVNSGVSKSDFE
ncbi:MAG: M16 family metallopeptidase [Weeksellaceae bacterium]